jgi:hypothetical protein
MLYLLHSEDLLMGIRNKISSGTFASVMILISLRGDLVKLSFQILFYNRLAI